VGHRDHTRTVYIPDKAPKRREQLNLSIEWDGRPKPKHTQEYRQWICWALGVAKNRTELWHFKPPATPELIETLNAGIP